MLTTGASAHTSSPASRCSAALHAAFPARSSGPKFAAIPFAVRGSIVSTSMPLSTPRSFPSHRRTTLSSPQAYAGSSSCPPYVGLTVVTASAVIIPAFMAFAQLPISSVSCQRSHESPSRSVTDESARRP